MLEDCDLPYRVHAVDIGAGAQFDAKILAISPNNKVPAIVDSDGPDGKPIFVFPWLHSAKSQGIDWADHTHLQGWFDEIAHRAAVLCGVEGLPSKCKPRLDDKAREALFGAMQYAARR